MLPRNGSQPAPTPGQPSRNTLQDWPAASAKRSRAGIALLVAGCRAPLAERARVNRSALTMLHVETGVSAARPHPSGKEHPASSTATTADAIEANIILSSTWIIRSLLNLMPSAWAGVIQRHMGLRPWRISHLLSILRTGGNDYRTPNWDKRHSFLNSATGDSDEDGSRRPAALRRRRQGGQPEHARSLALL